MQDFTPTGDRDADEVALAHRIDNLSAGEAIRIGEVEIERVDTPGRELRVTSPGGIHHRSADTSIFAAGFALAQIRQAAFTDRIATTREP